MPKVTCAILGALLIFISILGFLSTPAFKSDTWVNVIEIVFGSFGLIVGIWRKKPKSDKNQLR